ncbi:hypothetical protein [Alteromonas gilva]|uniref:Ribose-phosphate pyrophosphokinase n=1 Tax=Alteromonas gilva TaxID=2987522 RepID=A0ABT5L3W6_9ALTE|nr:hypothetical protein [Alteromonas gilva]MDC8830557.1 hypothetical protein [Alteromonas gilva]
MGNKYVIAPVLVLITCGLWACNDSPEQAEHTTMSNPTEYEPDKQEQATAPQHFRGTIVYKSIEGGFFALITDDNQRYTLRKLPAEYRLDGAVVEVVGSINHDMLTVTQFGELLEVESVTVIDKSHVKTPPTTKHQLKSL